MIRRHVGQEFWLITQDDHAQISGQLAAQIGNEKFPPPSSSVAVAGIALHDCGWPLHDDEPTLNANGLPLDVFESTMEIGLRVWEASADRATQQDDYAGLLVSLHSLGLSVFAAGHWNMNDPRTRFELNRFQHKMIELQESLRQRLGMRTDRPLKNGLAEDSSDPKEQRLLSDFRWLGAMDKLSLALCCTKPPFPVIESFSIKVQRNENDVILDPWPFGKSEIEIAVPYRRVAASKYADEREFHETYSSAPRERFTAAVRKRTI